VDQKPSAVSEDSAKNVAANRAYHDYAAENYDRDPRVRLGVKHKNCGKRLEWLKRHYLKSADGLVVLNLGAGTGNLIQKSQEVFGYTVGLDVSANMLKKAKRSGGRFLQADALNIPLKDHTCDVVFCVAVLHHICDLKSFFRSVYRVLKPGGVFYSDYDPNRKFYQLVSGIPLMRFGLSVYKKISDLSVFNKEGPAEIREIHDLAEYHEELFSGLDPQEVVSLAKAAGFSQVSAICHSDAPDLDSPQRGRLIHGAVDAFLKLFSDDYTQRAKIFSIVAMK